ncbi:MAG: NAD(P)-dependent oxidoreductase [Bacillota bacterium]|nr:NAD(P)-dependent oxidoreductase [Bacillota bacterium]
MEAAHALSPTVQVVDQLKDLYPVCDYISIHVPANDQTRNMINAEAFTQMKDGVVFLNFARDKLINDEDLLAAIDSGRVGRYVTDFADDAVLNADKEQIIVIPHLGASSAEAEDNCASMAVDQVMDYLENGNITNSVNFPAVSMGPKKGVRLCVMAKADAGAAEKVAAALPGVDMVCASKGDVTVVLAETTGSVDASALSGEGIIRVRVIE